MSKNSKALTDHGVNTCELQPLTQFGCWSKTVQIFWQYFYLLVQVHSCIRRSNSEMFSSLDISNNISVIKFRKKTKMFESDLHTHTCPLDCCPSVKDLVQFVVHIPPVF